MGCYKIPPRPIQAPQPSSTIWNTEHKIDLHWYKLTGLAASWCFRDWFKALRIYLFLVPAWTFGSINFIVGEEVSTGLGCQNAHIPGQCPQHPFTTQGVAWSSWRKNTPEGQLETGNCNLCLQGTSPPSMYMQFVDTFFPIFLHSPVYQITMSNMTTDYWLLSMASIWLLQFKHPNINYQIVRYCTLLI